MHPILLAYQQYFTAVLSYWGLIGIGDFLTTWPGGRFRRVRLAELNKEKEERLSIQTPLLESRLVSQAAEGSGWALL